ncbi:unnamed protein product [Mytilus edulis]|uniref:Uncharacterized protein n=1 Tax=Mytilus edulis TaxID=6550 RepID=A0A8S3R329_MYTED|nr:unnamed protein product [Mytilus edulis]
MIKLGIKMSWIFLLQFVFCFSNGREVENVEFPDGDKKRLLINDPDAINNRLEHLERSLQQQQATILQLTSNMPLNQGSNYIQWGKLSCSAANAETVYSGFATGQHYDTTKYSDRFGGPANFLCLPNNPELSNRTIPGNSFLYGTEYEENFLHSDSDGQDVPCAFLQESRFIFDRNVSRKKDLLQWLENGIFRSTVLLISVREEHRYAAGQIYYDRKSTTRIGGPGNMLCLPNNPELSNRTASGNSNIYGSEFEESTFGHGSRQEDVPCALCRSRNSTTSVMIPGRKTCFKGWKIEYNGLLASSCNTCKASSYVCVDKNPEYIPGGETNDNQNLLYTTGTICGSLPCPPYHNNLELLCVVCSK